MEAACIRHTDIPGASKLFSDLLYRFDRVSQFYPAFPFDFDAYLKSARQVDYPRERREQMAAALAAINPDNRLLDLFSREGTVAVVTGQQVGFHGGPCYTVYKALSAVSIARAMTERGQAAVPVFWLATEDHDFAEIDHAWSFDARRQPHRWSVDASPQPQQPVGGVLIEGVPDGFRASLEGLPFAGEAAELIERAYRPGVSFGEAFRVFLKEVLGSHEVLVLDPLDPAVRRIGAPFLSEAGRRASELSSAVAERSRHLIGEGYHAQVHFEGKDASLFFLLDGDRRVSLKKENPADYASAAERLSPNALLRPVWQDYLLPTAVMIGGPAELAYLAQSAPLYEKLLGRQPVAMPRAGFTLFDSRSGKLMDRYGFRLPDLLTDNESFREQIAARLTPPAVSQAFDAAAAGTKDSLDRLHEALITFDPTIGEALKKSRAKIEYQLDRTSRKISRELLRRSERESLDSAYLTNLIYPHRHLQERFYSIVPFLAAHGRDLVDRVYENIHVNCPDHHILPV